jgi:alpha-tubulin suppressor-like RCC1 family protein
MTRRAGSSRAASLLLLLLAGCDAAQIVHPDEQVSYVAIAAGSAHSCALDSEGRAWCWGANGRGQLGIGDAGGSQRRPVAVAADERFRVIAAGGFDTCAIDTAGGLWCWGANDTGQVGDGTTRDASRPARVRIQGVFSAVAVGGGHACAATDAGVVFCWGSNLHGQIGTAAGYSTLVPVLVPVVVAGVPLATALAVGAEQSCAVTAYDTFCWGSNASYQLGAGTVNDSRFPVRLATSYPAVRVASGLAHACALRMDREIECWGAAEMGQLGRGPEAPAASPRYPRLPDLPFTAVGAGGKRSCAATGAAVWCWGEETSAGLGPIATVPHPIDGITGPVVDLAVGDHHACAIEGTAFYCWGDDSSGQLGQGS